jgi:hypothetical protein
VKVHGDYLDARFRNTPAELGAYEPATNALLDRICDEYGMIIVGWSATWDVALREALERAANRRFTTYFCAREAVSTPAKDLLDRRGFRLITIRDANSLLAGLVERTGALATQVKHPLSVPLAIATVKRLLLDPQQRIRLFDLVTDEAKQLALKQAKVLRPQQRVTL